MDRKDEAITVAIKKAGLSERVTLLIHKGEGPTQLYLHEGALSVPVLDQFDAVAVLARWDFRTELNHYLSNRYVGSIEN